ncbi:MAG: cadmium-translocating P-type ATPase, partial [Desulfovibrio sp.]|nr:cadmium-translocating P-type ATPase [Desulfovibrio sp.]
ALVEGAANKKSVAEHFITSFARWYTPIVVGLALLLGVIPPFFFAEPWEEWLHRAFVFLIVSCPCALVISIPLTFFGGIGRASRHGILIKGSNYLEILSKVGCVVFDKTGTLTRGIFTVTAIEAANGIEQEEVLKYARIAESNSHHPIASSINWGMTSFPQVERFSEEPGVGVCAVYQGMTLRAGNERILAQEHIDLPEIKASGTRLYVIRDSTYLGCILLNDLVRSGSADCVKKLRSMGIKKIKVLTGDDPNKTAAFCKQLGIDDYHAHLLPEQKVHFLEQEVEKIGEGKKVAFVGDGINDAPVLARADVGIAMGRLGSDAAIEAADVVLMKDDPNQLVEGILIAKCTKTLVWQNIIFALSAKILFLVLGVLGMIGLWFAVFADVGVMILAVLNALRIMRCKIILD